MDVIELSLEVYKADGTVVLKAGWYYRMRVIGYEDDAPSHCCGPHETKEEAIECANFNTLVYLEECVEWLQQRTLH